MTSADGTIAGRGAEHRSVASAGVGQERGYRSTGHRVRPEVALDDVVGIGDVNVQVEGERTVRGELTDQDTVGTSGIHTRSSGQGRIGIIDPGEGVTRPGEGREVQRTAQVGGERWHHSGDATVVAAEAGEHTAGGEVAVGISGTRHTDLGSVRTQCTARGSTTGGTGGTQGDVGIEQGTRGSTTRLGGEFRPEVVIVPEGGGGREIGRVACIGAIDLQEAVVGGHVHVHAVHFGTGHDREGAIAQIVVQEIGVGLSDGVELFHDHPLEALRLGGQARKDQSGTEQGCTDRLFHGFVLKGDGAGPPGKAQAGRPHRSGFSSRWNRKRSRTDRSRWSSPHHRGSDHQRNQRWRSRRNRSGWPRSNRWSKAQHRAGRHHGTWHR